LIFLTGILITFDAIPLIAELSQKYPITFLSKKSDFQEEIRIENFDSVRKTNKPTVYDMFKKHMENRNGAVKANKPTIYNTINNDMGSFNIYPRNQNVNIPLVRIEVEFESDNKTGLSIKPKVEFITDIIKNEKK